MLLLGAFLDLRIMHAALKECTTAVKVEKLKAKIVLLKKHRDAASTAHPRAERLAHDGERESLRPTILTMEASRMRSTWRPRRATASSAEASTRSQDDDTAADGDDEDDGELGLSRARRKHASSQASKATDAAHSC